MNEHTQRRPESDIHTLKQEVNHLLDKVFDGSDITQMTVTPTSGDEWKINMPNLLAVTSYRDKKLTRLFFFQIVSTMISHRQIIITFDDNDKVQFVISRWTGRYENIEFSRPFESGNLYKVTEHLTRDIGQDQGRLTALKEVLGYSLLIRDLDQLPSREVPN